MKRSGSAFVAPAAALLAAVLSAGCNSILDTSVDIPERAQVTITGSTPVPLTLVMSSRFIGIRNPDTGRWDITLNQADTVIVTDLPITREHPMNETGVFFAYLGNPDIDATASITMEVRMDGRQVYRQEATIRDASIEYVYFTQ